MVKLVDDEEVERVRGDPRHRLLVERLDRGEDVTALRGYGPADEQLAEAAVAEHLPELLTALFENLPAVRDEEEREIAARLPPLAAVVESRDDRLSRPRRRDDEVAHVTAEPLG